MKLFNMTTAGAVLIIVVVILRAVFIHRLPKKTFVVLWGVALCRLLLPLSIPFKFSVYSFINLTKGTQPNILPQEYPSSPIPIQRFTPPMTGLENSNLGGLSPILLIWITGFILLGLFFIVVHLRCRTEYKMALPTENASVSKWLRKNKAKGKVSIRISDKITAPLTYGVWKPIILLPKTLDLTDEQQLDYVLTHEYTHIQRFDIVYKWILSTALCVHWFNPLVWIMYVLANRDLELSCDEMVVRTFGINSKSDYALALLGLEEKRSRLTPLVNNFSKNAIEERIVSIMKMKKTSVIALAAALLLIVGITTVFATNAKENTELTAVTGEQVTEINTPFDYSPYKDFGLIYDGSTASLSFQGEPVRYFEDFYPLGDGAHSGIDYFDKSGIIDVHGVRDLSKPTENPDGSMNPSGKLIGVEPYTEEEYTARNVSELISPPQGTTYAGEPLSDAEAVESFAEYKPYGLSYDLKTDRLYFEGKLVRHFLDVMASNGESFEGGNFSGAMRRLANDDGEVDVYTVRDFNVVDKDGTGKLLDVKAHSDEEFKQSTKPSENNFSFLWPTVETEVKASFNEYPGHSGIDIKGTVGTSVYASASGTVITATTGYTGYGNYIQIDHGGGYVTLYAHCNDLHVAVGESVTTGQIIATIGSTGNTTDNCMHFEIQYNGNMLDPIEYLFAKDGTIQ